MGVRTVAVVECGLGESVDGGLLGDLTVEAAEGRLLHQGELTTHRHRGRGEEEKGRGQHWRGQGEGNVQ